MHLLPTHSFNSWECSRQQRLGLALCVGAALLLPLLQPASPPALASSSAAPLASLTLAFAHRPEPAAAQTTSAPTPAHEPAEPIARAEPAPVSPTSPAPAQTPAQPAATKAEPEPALADTATPEAPATTATSQDQPRHGPNELPLMDTPLFAEPPQPPRYPMLARRRGQTGTVWLAVTLDADGSPDRLSLLASSGVAALDQAALDAVSHWRFLPYRIDGQALASRVHIPVQFSLN